MSDNEKANDDLDAYRKLAAEMKASMQPPNAHPCPSCGHCPTCGRGGPWTAPYYPYYPYQPYAPMWIGDPFSTSGNAIPLTFTTGPNA